MKKHYPWLWFDADGTLFDYQRAEINALRQTFVSLALPFQDSYLDVYRRINDELWKALERRETTQAILRLRRFELLLEAIHLNASTDEMSSIYLEQLAMGTDLIEGAYEILQTLSQTCQIAIVTNGITAVQSRRFGRSTIQPFVRELIISEEIGVAKPSPAFFEVASARTGHPPKSSVLLIGDSLTSDIRGGVDYGIDTCWFNPTGEPGPEGWAITYRVGQLRELLEIIE
ncbi:MAG TPA: YjjG family noncanonical pyrimidine nucleotidase [Anaerolineales bacterium]|nr:YjjG family noncanonical pyrimidine nucleotidase [Anaerolineales bacterium]